MNNKNIATVRITKEALTDLEYLIDDGKNDGLTEVFAQYLKDEDRFSVHAHLCSG